MGYLIAGHILTVEPMPEILKGLPDSIGWRLFRDGEFGVPCLDTFSRVRKTPHPFSSFPTKRDVPANIPDGLEIISKAARAFSSLGNQDSLNVVMLTLGLRISELLRQRVCTFCSDDEGLDFVSTTSSGTLERLVCRCEDLEFTYASGQGTIQPLLAEMDGDEPYETDLSELARQVSGVAVLPRDKPQSCQLHGVVGVEVVTFLGRDCLPLGIGSFDPPSVEPVLLAASEAASPKPARVATKPKPWWRFW